MGRNPIDLWSQFYLIDKGATLGKHISIYREGFFEPKENFLGYTEWHFDKSKEEELNKKIANISLRYGEEEANDLPPLVRIPKYVNFVEENFDHYKSMINKLLEVKEDRTAFENTFIKLRQICSGFLSFKNPDDEKTIVDFEVNTKMNQLIEIIDSIPDNRKIVIFNEFTHSGDMIAKMLTSKKIKFERLYGGTKDKVKGKINFINDKSTRVFLINNQSGGTALDGLQEVCNYVILYELPVSPIVFNQIVKRVHRTGQKNRTFMFSIIVKHSIEEKVLAFLKAGKNLFEALIEGKEKLEVT